MSEVEAIPETPQTEEELAEPVKEVAEETEKVEETAEEANGDEPIPEEVEGDVEEEVEEEEEEMTVDLDALPKMKVSELKDILKALDLPTSGIKTTLIERIHEHFAEEDKQVEGTGEKEEVSEETELLEENKPAPEFIELKKAEEKTAVTAPEKSDEEKKKERAEKFGVLSAGEKKEEPAAGEDTDQTIETKKEERAAKFGITTPNAVADKKAERAARFGANAAANKLSVSTDDKNVDDEKLKKRKARFNLDSEPTAKSAKLVTLDDISEKLKEKIESGTTQVNLSAATLSLEEKKKLRALKFGA